ncbi:TonB-dependent receptor [Anaerorudis cellulosivorans]|uniref:TonB-dependent receptor n=1 Tax=Anaerorudis cellulosivorans TaxID=3397862 RepID=UPI00221EA8BC|nr:TonB-dependent receptor [Seramator thermalis]MCW1735829.1 TonB-dependent receptor [Seramator thermalis]
MVKRKSALSKLSVLVLCFISVTDIFAQTGIIKGKIIDSKTNEPLIGASILVEGTTNGTASDLDGNFVIRNVRVGKVRLKASYVAYRPQIKSDVIIEQNRETIVDFALLPDEYALSEVEVVAKVNRESENILLLEQRKALVATQAVGARELSRKGLGNAEAAVTAISGISKQEGVKNVFIRGLGDRYNFTTLNGFPVPSEDPEYKNISLDFFGKDIIQNIEVNKVFTGGNYADVGGAIIDISTKELINDGAFSFDISGGINTKTIGSGFLKQDGVNYFGIANKKQPSTNLQVYDFSNSLDPSSLTSPLNHSYGFAGGKRFMLGDNHNPFSFFVTAVHSSDYSYTDETIRNTTSTGVVYQDMGGNKSSQNINQLMLANMNLELAKKHQLTYNFMLVHDNDQYVGNYLGIYTDKYQSGGIYDSQGYLRRQQSNDNLLITNQLMANSKLTDVLTIDAGISYNNVKGIEPDRRLNNLYRKTETTYELLAGTGNQQRYFSTLKENDINTKVGLIYKFSSKFANDASMLKVGYNGRFVGDDFEAVEYDMTAIRDEAVSLDAIHLDELYNQQNLTNGLFSLDRNIDRYEVTKNMHAAYAEVTYQFSPFFTGNLGLRFDDVYLLVAYNVDRGGTRGQAKIDKSYFLPMLNLKYDFSDKQILRLGISKTYTLPQSKEISPYKYIGINFKSQGNPDLKPSDNYHVDLKWDYYFSPSELISFAGFYKYIHNPILRIEANNAGGYLTYKNISDYAMVGGIEMEMRKNIFNRVSTAVEKTNRLSIGLNASYIYSHLKVTNVENTPEKNSKLEGAAPFLLNGDISHTYVYRNKVFTNSLVCGFFSDRIYTIGTTGFQDIVEQGILTLDFVSSTRFNRNFEFKLKAGNILNPAYRLTRHGNNGGGNVILSEYKKGVDLSLGLTYDF